jgi:hypothetical protein
VAGSDYWCCCPGRGLNNWFLAIFQAANSRYRTDTAGVIFIIFYLMATESTEEHEKINA